jgi:K+-transporting ATPase KdpF subunit
MRFARLMMVFDLYLGSLVSLALALYLGYALFYPEKF